MPFSHRKAQAGEQRRSNATGHTGASIYLGAGSGGGILPLIEKFWRDKLDFAQA
jgi:hypothetical protein